MLPLCLSKIIIIKQKGEEKCFAENAVITYPTAQ